MFVQRILLLTLATMTTAATAACPKIAAEYRCWYGIISVDFELKQRISGNSTRLDIYFDGDRRRLYLDGRRRTLSLKEFPELKGRAKNMRYWGKCQNSKSIYGRARGKTLDKNKVSGDVNGRLIITKKSNGIGLDLTIDTKKVGSKNWERDRYNLSCRRLNSWERNFNLAQAL